MIAQTKRIIFTFWWSKWTSCFLVFLSEFSNINRKHVLYVSIELHIENNGRTWKSCGNILLLACVPTEFLVLPNFHCFGFLYLIYMYNIKVFLALVETISLHIHVKIIHFLPSYCICLLLFVLEVQKFLSQYSTTLSSDNSFFVLINDYCCIHYISISCSNYR